MNRSTRARICDRTWTKQHAQEFASRCIPQTQHCGNGGSNEPRACAGSAGDGGHRAEEHPETKERDQESSDEEQIGREAPCFIVERPSQGVGGDDAGNERERECPVQIHWPAEADKDQRAGEYDSVAPVMPEQALGQERIVGRARQRAARPPTRARRDQRDDERRNGGQR